MSTQYEIRLAEISDQNMIGALWLALLDEHARLDPRFSVAEDALIRWKNDFPEWLHSSSDRIWIAVANTVPIGFLSAERWLPPPIHDDDVELYVKELYVSPLHRRKGVGTLLLNAMNQWAMQTGIQRLRIGVLAQNEQGYSFWKKRGATPFSQTLTLDLP